MQQRTYSYMLELRKKNIKQTNRIYFDFSTFWIGLNRILWFERFRLTLEINYKMQEERLLMFIENEDVRSR